MAYISREVGKILFVIFLSSAVQDSWELHELSKENKEFSPVKTQP